MRLRKSRSYGNCHIVTGILEYISTDNSCIGKPLKNSTLHWHKIRLLHTQITETKHESCNCNLRLRFLHITWWN